jgi:predicted DNA-binding protein (UPF0251 family)
MRLKVVGIAGVIFLMSQEVLYTLSCTRDVRAKIDANELSTVRQARELDVTWTEIASALGVSRQAAWERLREMDAFPASG